MKFVSRRKPSNKRKREKRESDTNEKYTPDRNSKFFPHTHTHTQYRIKLNGANPRKSSGAHTRPRTAKSPIRPNRIEKSFCSIWRRLISQPGSLPLQGLGVGRGFAFSRQSSGRNRQIEFDRLPTAIGVSASENTSRFENWRKPSAQKCLTFPSFNRAVFTDMSIIVDNMYAEFRICWWFKKNICTSGSTRYLYVSLWWSEKRKSTIFWFIRILHGGRDFLKNVNKRHPREAILCFMRGKRVAVSSHKYLLFVALVFPQAEQYPYMSVRERDCKVCLSSFSRGSGEIAVSKRCQTKLQTRIYDPTATNPIPSYLRERIKYHMYLCSRIQSNIRSGWRYVCLIRYEWTNITSTSAVARYVRERDIFCLTVWEWYYVDFSII